MDTSAGFSRLAPPDLDEKGSEEHWSSSTVGVGLRRIESGLESVDNATRRGVSTPKGRILPTAPPVTDRLTGRYQCMQVLDTAPVEAFCGIDSWGRVEHGQRLSMARHRSDCVHQHR